MNIPLEQYRQAADYIRAHLTGQPEVCLVLGSGLGRLADEVEDAVRIPYADIPGFPRSTVASHAGMMLCGRLCGREVIVMAGRFHYYEGYDMETAAFYVRVMHLLGVRRLLLTNAAGGVNPDFRVGDFMLIADHIKLCAESPARGAGEPAFGPRFFDMTRTYSPALLTLARTCAQTLGQPLREGVYFFMAAVRSLKRRRKSARSGFWAAMRSACRRLRKHSRRHTAGWSCSAFRSLPTWQRACWTSRSRPRRSAKRGA